MLATSLTHRSRGPRSAALTVTLALGAIGCGSHGVSGDTVRIGVLLPYTGEASAISANLERGAWLAVTEMNRAGGVGDVPVEVVFANTFSDAERSRESAQELIAEGVVAVIGPGGDEVSAPVHRALSEGGVPLVSPIASTTVERDPLAIAPWFRISPTTEVIGQNLAKLAGDQGVARLSAVVSGDNYHSELGEAFAQRFESYGQMEDFVVYDDSSLDTLVTNIAEAMESGLEGVMLAVHPRAAARIATEVSLLREGESPPRWYLTPRLKTDLLLQNSTPRALEGAVGISPEVFASTRGEFEEQFEKSAGDVPFDPTFFMYDAAAVTLIAMDRALARGDELPSGLAPAIEEVASFGGRLVRWNDFERARDINRDAGAMQYTGLTGPVIFAESGSRMIGTTSVWGVENGTIVDR